MKGLALTVELSEPSPAPDAPDDRACLEAVAQNRDREAFARLFQRHEQAAYSLALRITRNRQAAEEAVQEAFLRVWLSASTYRAEGSVRGWLLRVAARESLKALQSRQRTREEMITEIAREKKTELDEPAENAERGELAAALRRALDDLPAAERRLVALYYGGGLSQEEIGAALEMPQRTVSLRIKKALETMRAHLTQIGFAAAAPTLDAGGLGEALCSGYPVPPGLREKVMNRIARAGQESIRAEALGRAGKARSGSLVFYASCAAALALAGGAAWWMYTPAPVAPAAPANSPARKLVEIEKNFQDIDWSFADAPAKGFRVLRGSWTWEPGEKPGDGRMVGPLNERVFVEIPLDIPERPLLITLDCKTPPNVSSADSAHVGVYWLDTDVTVTCGAWQREPVLQRNMSYHTYSCMLGKREIIYFKDPSNPVVVRVWNELPSGKKAALHLQNMSLTGIHVHALKPEEITEALQFWRDMDENMIKSAMERATRKVLHKKSELKPSSSKALLNCDPRQLDQDAHNP